MRRGLVLAELDKHAHPLARFTRSLRLGLGNREGDPLLARALELVDGLRDFDMTRMYDVTEQLAALFGGASEIAEVFCSSESLEDGDRERDVHGADLDDGELQREVDRILDSAQARVEAARRRPAQAVDLRQSERRLRAISTVQLVAAIARRQRVVASDVTTTPAPAARAARRSRPALGRRNARARRAARLIARGSCRS